jgi:hypothetical protein
MGKVFILCHDDIAVELLLAHDLTRIIRTSRIDQRFFLNEQINTYFVCLLYAFKRGTKGSGKSDFTFSRMFFLPTIT